MKDSLQWLTERAAQPGTLACGLRRPDGTFVTNSADSLCAGTTVESILAKFDTLVALSTESMAPQWSTWVFEQAQIRLVGRPDGWRLALVIRNESAAAPALDSVSQEFLNAPLGA